MQVSAFSRFLTAVTPAKAKYAVISGLSAAVSAVATRYFVNAEQNTTIQSLLKRIEKLEANQHPMTLIVGNGNAKGLRPSRR